MKNLEILFNENFPCKSHLYIPIEANSTISELITPCFAFVLLPSILAGFSISCLIFLIFYGFIILSPKLLFTKLLGTKLFISTVILLLSFIRLILILFYFETKDFEAIIGAFCIFIIALTSTASYFRCWKSGILSSIWLHLIYFLRFITIILEVIVINNLSNPNFILSALLEFEAMCVIFMIFLFCFADKFDGNYQNFYNQKPCDPDRMRSSLARAVFAQTGHLMSKGYAGTLDFDSLWALDPRNQPERLLILFKKFRSKSTETKKFIPWLFFVLFKCTWFSLTAGLILTIVSAFFTISEPIFLKLIIISAENHYPLWVGLTLVILSLIISWTKFSLVCRADFYGFLANLDVQSILMNVIYQKMLKLSAAARIKYSAGEVVNLLSIDVERIQKFWFDLLDFIYTPLLILLCFIGLFFTIGINVLYGIGIILLFIPLNNFVANIETKCQQKQMHFTDARLKILTDVLSGIKVLKLYAWEESMRARIAKIRQNEITQMKYVIFCYSAMEITFNSCPILATIASFFGYIVIQGHPLTPEVAFISLMLFNLMKYSIYRIPGLVRGVIETKVSLNRVQNFLLESEIPEITNTIPSSENTVIQLKNANFSWSNESIILPTLKSINLEIFDGELIGIIGRVGAGKSSLLSAICGELNQCSGTFYRKPGISVAYVPQESWIQNLSLRDNILFGKEKDENFYHEVIEVCALKDDLKHFVAGDETEIGERGLNLSGGQKARVALARAVYQNSDIYILDDILSAVDSHVGKHIFENVIGKNGILKNKTRIFALNSINFLANCDKIVVLKEGSIVDCGTFDELISRQNETFNELIKELKAEKEIEKEIETEIIADEEEDDKLVEEAPSIQENVYSFNTESDTNEPIHRCRRTSSNNSNSAPQPLLHQFTSQQQLHEEVTARLIEDENLEVGKVSFKLYWNYIKAFGVTIAITYAIFVFIFRTFFESFSQIWMAKWSSGSKNGTDIITETKSLEIYGIFGISSCIISGIAGVIMSFGAFQASKKLHDNLLFSLLRSPLNFFDCTPLGRILNRLSKDIEKIDNEVRDFIPYTMVLTGECLFYTVSALWMIPEVGFLSIPVIAIFVIITRYYTYTSVQIRRLCSISWSAVTSHTQESYIGLNTIRIFSVQNRFAKQMLQKGVTSVEANLGEISSNRWIQFRMDFLASIFSSSLTAFAIYFGYTGLITPGGVALVATTGIMLRGLLAEIARTIKNLEMSIVAVERVQEYIDNEHEAEWISSSNPPLPPSWPSNGNICFKDFSLRYRPSAPLILKRINLEIKGAQKIGIVGRTGAGKTSLTMALFRMFEPSEGTIYIDGIDFRQLGLHELRQALTIIPQDPILFCGTLRIYLDPFEEFSDPELWDALGKAHLQKFLDQLHDKLNHEISEGGGNLSIGQRQLICLARAILRKKKTKILILDEATAAVDLKTDLLIQDTIRKLFSKCTILTIAHRINTILDYDKVLVMDYGEIKEFDSPSKLLSSKNSLFYALAAQAKIV